MEQTVSVSKKKNLAGIKQLEHMLRYRSILGLYVQYPQLCFFYELDFIMDFTLYMHFWFFTNIWTFLLIILYYL